MEGVEPLLLYIIHLVTASLVHVGLSAVFASV